MVSENALSTMVYLLTESFFGRSTDQIYLLLMQGICAYPGLSIEAVDHELFFIVQSRQSHAAEYYDQQLLTTFSAVSFNQHINSLTVQE